MKNPASLRKLLRQEIEDHLEGLDCIPAVVDPPKLKALLNTLLTGLLALDEAEVRPIFRPSPPATKVGPYRAQVRELKIRAVAYVNSLTRRVDKTSPKAGKKYGLVKACAEIGEAYGVDGETIKGWRRDIKKYPIKDDQLSSGMTRLAEMVREDRARMWRGTPSDRDASYVIKLARRDGKKVNQLVPGGLSKPKKSKGY